MEFRSYKHLEIKNLQEQNLSGVWEIHIPHVQPTVLVKYYKDVFPSENGQVTYFSA